MRSQLFVIASLVFASSASFALKPAEVIIMQHGADGVRQFEFPGTCARMKESYSLIADSGESLPTQPASRHIKVRFKKPQLKEDGSLCIGECEAGFAPFTMKTDSKHPTVLVCGRAED